MCGFLVVGSEEFELQVFQKALDKAAYRGPDYQHVSIDHGITWGFNRLSIMDLSTNGNQPFVYKDYTLVCNGEIYNYPALKTKLESSYTFKSGSDCEVLIPLYEQYGLEILCKYLDAEFALVLYDNKTKQLMAARDPMGIRPMFYGYSKKEHQICFASEAKALFDLCDDIMPFPPGHYYLDGQFVCYNDLSDPKTIVDDDLETIAGKLKTKLEKAVEKRFMSDAVGHSMVDYLKELAEDKYSDEDVLNAKDKYSYCTPFTKESLMYRDIFESFFPQQGKWIKDFWMPNKEWENCDVDDPSARVLKNYGDSGK